MNTIIGKLIGCISKAELIYIPHDPLISFLDIHSTDRHIYLPKDTHMNVHNSPKCSSRVKQIHECDIVM